MKIIFLLQEHNSIDQITPLIELLYENEYNILLVKTLNDYNYNTDTNIKYLLEKYQNIEIIDIYNNENSFYKLLNNAYSYFNLRLSKQTNKFGKLLYWLFAGITKKIMVKFMSINENDASDIFKNCNVKNTILVTEITNGDNNYFALIKKASDLKFKNISFTHGFDVLENQLLGYDDLVLKNEELENHATKYADKLVVFNSLAVKRKSGAHQEKIVQLPSLRFTTQWIDLLKLNKKQFVSTSNSLDKLKIVFMLSAVGYNIWEDEQFRTIKTLLLHEDIYLAVKVHPRDIRIKNKFQEFKQDNFEVIDNSISSSALIDWSDIVITIGSGIILEAIIKNKIIFYIKYLHCNSIELENTKKLIHQIATRDELVILLEKYKANLNNDYIDLDERKAFLKDYICNDNFNENKQKYLDLFESI
jgi:hypothetical protein